MHDQVVTVEDDSETGSKEVLDMLVVQTGYGVSVHVSRQGESEILATIKTDYFDGKLCILYWDSTMIGENNDPKKILLAKLGD